MWFRGTGTVKTAEAHSYHPAVVVDFQKNAWADVDVITRSHHEIVKPWLDEHIAPGLKHIVFADNLSSQRKEPWIEAVQEFGGEVGYGPASLTHLWSPIDRGHIGACLKHIAKGKLDAWLELESITQPGKKTTSFGKAIK